MKKLIICEKPSLSRNVLEALPGKKEKRNGYYETQDYFVSYAFGHLFSLKDLEEYEPVNEAKHKWTLDNLPFFPETFQFRLKKDPKTKKTDPGVKAQYEALKTLMNSDAVESIIHCGDADREGEVIIRLIIMNGLKKKKTVYRLWLPEQTAPTIRAGLKNLRLDSEYDNLMNEGLARTYIDWAYGINFTRLASIKSGTLMRVGRVITPIVREIYERELEIQNFVPEKSWGCVTEISVGGKKIRLSSSTKFPLEEKEQAEKYCNKMNQSRLFVTDVSKKEERRNPGKLFSLSKLQGFLGKKYRYSPQETLGYVQSLYEKGYVTYPRTNTEYLSENEAEKADRLVELFSGLGFNVTKKRGKKIFDDSKIESHSALLPTEKIPDALPDNERNTYNVIRNRFFAVFCAADCIVERTTVIIGNELEAFKITGCVVKQPGYMEYEDDAGKEVILPSMKIGDSFRQAFELEIRETKPPKRYTVESLNAFLKNPFRKKEDIGGEDDQEEYKAVLAGIEIGTEATRASIIDNAIRSGYISLKKNTYFIEQKGTALVRSLDELGIDISKETTVEISMLLKRIYKNEATIDQALEAAKEKIRIGFSKKDNRISDAVKYTDQNTKSKNAIASCPICGKPILEGQKLFYCSGDNCNVKLWKNNKYFSAIGFKLTEKRAASLFKTGRVLAKGLPSKKSPDKTYDAYIVADFSREPVGFSMEFPNKNVKQPTKAKSGKNNILNGYTPESLIEELSTPSRRKK